MKDSYILSQSLMFKPQNGFLGSPIKRERERERERERRERERERERENAFVGG